MQVGGEPERNLRSMFLNVEKSDGISLFNLDNMFIFIHLSYWSQVGELTRTLSYCMF